MKVSSPSELLRLARRASLRLGHPQLASVLARLTAISKVTFDDKVGTAAIAKIGQKYVISFSPEFVKSSLQTDEEILFVLLHEIMHKIHGDHDRLPADAKEGALQPLANIATDIHINAWLYENFFPNGCDLLRRMYAKDDITSVVLCPPIELLRTFGSKYERSRGGIAEDHNACFSSQFVYELAGRMGSVLEQFEWPDSTSSGVALNIYLWGWKRNMSVATHLRHLAKILPEPDEDVLLLGNHDGDDDVCLPDWLTKTMKAGHGNRLQEDEVVPAVLQNGLHRLLPLVRRAIEPDVNNPREALLMMPERSVIPGAGRRDVFLLSSGVWPTFFQNDVWQTQIDESRVHIYLDVSGSMSDILPVLYGMALQLHDLIGEPIYLFSNQVAEISLAELRTGKVDTTCGTDFNCVIEHASRNRFRKLLIVTDGFADLNAYWTNYIVRERLGLYLLLTEGSFRYETDIQKLAKAIWHLQDFGLSTTHAPRMVRRRRKVYG